MLSNTLIEYPFTAEYLTRSLLDGSVDFDRSITLQIYRTSSLGSLVFTTSEELEPNNVIRLVKKDDVIVYPDRLYPSLGAHFEIQARVPKFDVFGNKVEFEYVCVLLEG